jgi:hypothetical protein
MILLIVSNYGMENNNTNDLIQEFFSCYQIPTEAMFISGTEEINFQNISHFNNFNKMIKKEDLNNNQNTEDFTLKIRTIINFLKQSFKIDNDKIKLNNMNINVDKYFNNFFNNLNFYHYPEITELKFLSLSRNH